MIQGNTPIEGMSEAQALEALGKVLKRLQGLGETAQVKAKEILAQHPLTTKTATEASEGDKQARLWAKQKAMHLALAEAMRAAEDDQGFEVDGNTFAHSINVWTGQDKRVYIDAIPDARNAWKICYYVTGNAYNPPGWLSITGSADGLELLAKAQKAGPEQQQLQAFCGAVASHWNNVKSSSDVALATGLEAWAKHLAIYREALQLEEESDG
jgi:hypothetical protein